MPPLGAYAFVAVVAALGTYLIMFPVARLANRYGLVAEPDERHRVGDPGMRLQLVRQHHPAFAVDVQGLAPAVKRDLEFLPLA